ncbi:MAG: Trk system potassium transporter TrkA [Spirochaetales bacterium]|nr:Trk system potassium transporter TrkA [Spirochaetales bacterium]MBO4716572.1 Trk system potassium transporter TrkA [Spirochaetales bacterium]MBR5098441.1 Trk system potassium transporter TrkA [Spirochaetales bacterium]
MKVVILGAGRRGIRLARHLVEENKDVIIIDEDAEDVNTAMSKVDCLAIKGSGTSLEDLSDAGIDDADAFVALTGSDETNLVSSGIASSEFKVPLTIASIRNLSYTGYSGIGNSLMGITHIVNPTQEVAQYIYQDVERGIYSDIISFENSSLLLYNVYVEKDSPYAEKVVKQLRQELNANFIIAALSRGGEALVPSGDTVVRPGDTLSLVAQEESVNQLLSSVGRKSMKAKHIAIVGASQVADFLLRAIPKYQHRDIALIDKDKEVCERMATIYPDVLVLNADITNEAVFEEEGLGSYDLMLCLTSNDELNIITASYAKHFGIKNSLALVSHNPNYIRMADHLDIDNIISTQDVTVDSLMRYMHGQNVSSTHSLFDGQIEALEFTITEGNQIIGKALKDIDMRGKGIIAGVTKKDGRTLIPGGLYVIEQDDALITVIERKSTDFIQRLLHVGSFMEKKD